MPQLQDKYQSLGTENNFATTQKMRQTYKSKHVILQAKIASKESKASNFEATNHNYQQRYTFLRNHDVSMSNANTLQLIIQKKQKKITKKQTQKSKTD